MYVVPDEFIGRLLASIVMLVGMVFLLCSVSVFIWGYYRKNGGMRECIRINGDPVEILSEYARISWFLIVIYICTLPLMALALFGAKSFTDMYPSWKLGITLFLITVSWAFLYPLGKRIFNICWYMCILGAAAIDGYVEKEYPMEHHESKPGNRQYMRRRVGDR